MSVRLYDVFFISKVRKTFFYYLCLKLFFKLSIYTYKGIFPKSHMGDVTTCVDLIIFFSEFFPYMKKLSILHDTSIYRYRWCKKTVLFK